MNDVRPAPDRVVVTGATGLLGGAVVRALLAAGHQVTALVRDPEKAARLLPADTRITVATADITDPAAYRHALRGADAVVHTAAYFREYYQPGADHGRMHAVNVESVTALLREAVDAGVPTVVHTSSITTIGPGTPEAPADEDTPPPAHWERNGYRASKVRAERAVAEFGDREGLTVPLVLPGWMWGPGDDGPTSAGRLFLSVARGELRAVPRSGNHVVDARDVADTCVAALTRGRGLRRYAVAGSWYGLHDLVGGIAAATGRPAPREIPAAAALAFATVLEQGARLRGRPPVATREGVRVLLDGARTRISSARARQELGTAFRPLAETLADEARWYRDQGRLPA
ncbi:MULTISPECIES: NAD-dependent epimerase/dehydratase family protein [Kitasatospora]|uniref:Putative NAD-dependent epimerase/dehydratase n=1 Tax=Kitasatospora setae (strain ATCC 33774 / DSM 43861 / JCM 3304 / KCC A-0304 / NBRC 14216 / KM-6054) TaxID=452652 RepID=E4NA82_KITSK|nr:MULTISPECIES: NAD-dependent epimerase/dehydratase family protein [Kitasatospora]BAJ28113.1 putative NAD-dependent epimerase/dehydratase [Kitasatospora setae KM-6054]